MFTTTALSKLGVLFALIVIPVVIKLVTNHYKDQL